MATDTFEWEAPPNTTRQWEYASILHDIDADPTGLLNQLGADGWLLVSVLPVPLHQARCYFRRVKR